MCGIAGFLDASHQAGQDDLRGTVTLMSNAIRHRGPDDGGQWVDAEAGIALGHRRLSIVDLSPTGHQPMCSACGRYVIVFNGEIYNHQALRRELENSGRTFRGLSDTEVMLASIANWGVEVAIRRFNGMFAFALWDREERLLHLVRDRLGKKPLYYGWMGSVFLFGSELKALRAHPAFKAEVDRDALTLLLRHSYIPAPYSIYRGIHKLQSASILTIDGLEHGFFPAPVSYWSAKQVAENGVAEPLQGSSEEITTQLDTLLRDAVRMRMGADVPLGAFLSGGIDSSTIVALMQDQSAKPVQTFTIGFIEAGYNEAEHAKAVAQHLGTDHTELYVTPTETMAVIPHLPILYDEPFSDSSQIPTFLVSQLARQQVTVSLSGDGGDELFCGYNHYQLGSELWQKINRVPMAGRRAVAWAMDRTPRGVLDRCLAGLEPKLGRYGRPGSMGDKLHKLSEVLAVESPESLYRRIVSHWKMPASVTLRAHEPPTVLTDPKQWAALPELAQRMMYLDLVSYLPEDILVKVDRASMGVSMEARVPLLDHRVAEFAWSVPDSMKVVKGQRKWLLRQVLYKYVPRELVERPKMGFGVPIDAWLRGPLREWAEALLDEGRLQQEGYFNPQPIRQKWTEHLCGNHNWQYYLWDVLMFQAWLDQWILTAV